MTFKVTINDNSYIASQWDTLLEVVNRNSKGVEVYSECRVGLCGACACRLVKGDVRYLKEPLALIRSGFVLTCIASPLSDIELKN